MKQNKTLLIVLFISLALVLSAYLVYLRLKKKNNPLQAFPIKLGSSGRGVALMQISFDAPVTGIWDEAFNAIVKRETGREEFSRDDVIAYWITPALMAEDFPLSVGSQNGYVIGVEAMLGVKLPGEIFSTQTAALVSQATGKTDVDLNTYLNIAGKVLGEPLLA